MTSTRKVVTKQRPDELPLRIVVRRPPPGVTFAVQIGKSDLLAPASATPEALVFDVVARVDAGSSEGGAPRLLGPAVQGPPDGRFVYVNSGMRAGQAGTLWDRRAKVPLAGITRSLIRSSQSAPGSLIQTAIEGTGRDGGPCCGTVPLVDGGWSIVPE